MKARCTILLSSQLSLRPLSISEIYKHSTDCEVIEAVRKETRQYLEPE